MTTKAVKPIKKDNTKPITKVEPNTYNTHSEVLEHCMQVRENLLRCHSIEIISSYTETPNK